MRRGGAPTPRYQASALGDETGSGAIGERMRDSAFSSPALVRRLEKGGKRGQAPGKAAAG